MQVECGMVKLLDSHGVHYDTLFKTTMFWSAVPAQHILLFQADSVICWPGLDRQGLDVLLALDLVGAPWRAGDCPPDNDRSRSLCEGDFEDMVEMAYQIPYDEYVHQTRRRGVGGNGGLSLRRRSKMLEIVATCREYESMAWNEDVFFSFPCPEVELALPTREQATAFCVESGPMHPRPMAVHKPWRHRPAHDLKALSAVCPDLPLVAALAADPLFKLVP